MCRDGPLGGGRGCRVGRPWAPSTSVMHRGVDSGARAALGNWGGGNKRLRVPKKAWAGTRSHISSHHEHASGQRWVMYSPCKWWWQYGARLTQVVDPACTDPSAVDQESVQGFLGARAVRCRLSPAVVATATTPAIPPRAMERTGEPCTLRHWADWAARAAARSHSGNSLTVIFTR